MAPCAIHPVQLSVLIKLIPLRWSELGTCATHPCLCEVVLRHVKCLFWVLTKNYTLPIIQVFEQLNISTSPFTLKLLTVIKQLKSSKAFEPENIPGFLWKDSIEPKPVSSWELKTSHGRGTPQSLITMIIFSLFPYLLNPEVCNLQATAIVLNLRWSPHSLEIKFLLICIP